MRVLDRIEILNFIHNGRLFLESRGGGGAVCDIKRDSPALKNILCHFVLFSISRNCFNLYYLLPSVSIISRPQKSCNNQRPLPSQCSFHQLFSHFFNFPFTVIVANEYQEEEKFIRTLPFYNLYFNQTDFSFYILLVSLCCVYVYLIFHHAISVPQKIYAKSSSEYFPPLFFVSNISNFSSFIPILHHHIASAAAIVRMVQIVVVV